MAGDNNYRISLLSFLQLYVKICSRHDFSPDCHCADADCCGCGIVPVPRCAAASWPFAIGHSPTE